MADSTPQTPASRRPARARRILRGLLPVATACLLLAALAPGVRADGDPASDVLAAQSLFLPQDALASPAIVRRLAAALVLSTSRAPLRVAVIASPSDLGAVTALWREPESYARFLGQEVSLLYRGEILVVMPDGYGLARDGRIPSGADAKLLTRLGRPGRTLGLAALTASLRLLAAHGVSAPSGVARAGAPVSGGDPAVTWIVLGVGAVVIAAAWGYSMRARPPGAARAGAGTG